MEYALHLLIIFEIWALLAVGLDLMAGRLGVVTLAHAGYFAIGAYGYAIPTVALGWSGVACIMVGVGTATLLAAAVAVAADRLKRDFLVLATLALQVTIYFVIILWARADAPLASWTNLTNGSQGIAHIPRPEAFGAPLEMEAAFALFSTLVVMPFILLVWAIDRSPWARRATAIRDDELALRALGKDPRQTRIEAAVVSAAAAAIAGALFAAYAGYVDPSIGALEQSVLMLAMVVIGGLGSMRGALTGAAVVVGLPEILRFLRLPEGQAAPVRMMLFGALLVLLIHLRPAGLAGRYRLS
ncbi:MAG TPA: branched-chain amino acid ABC transporter permease [Caulobacteraceae bacterium]